MRRARQDAHDFLDGVVRQIGVEAVQRCAETAFEQNLGGTAALTRIVDLDAAFDDRSDLAEADGGYVFDQFFGGRRQVHQASA